MLAHKRHYPWTVYALMVLCGLGLASVAMGIADGWALMTAGASTIIIAVVRLHVILNRRRTGVAVRPLPMDRARGPKG